MTSKLIIIDDRPYEKHLLKYINIYLIKNDVCFYFISFNRCENGLNVTIKKKPIGSIRIEPFLFPVFYYLFFYIT